MGRLLTLLNPYRFVGGGGGGGAQPGITALGALEPISNSSQYGYEFTVGASDITVTKLRAFRGASGDLVYMFLWRVSDEALLADPTVTSVADDWAEVDLDTPVVLAAGANYIVGERTLASRPHFYSTDEPGFAFSSAITYVQTRTVGSAVFPTGVSANGPWGVADVVFTT